MESNATSKMAAVLANAVSTDKQRSSSLGMARRLNECQYVNERVFFKKHSLVDVLAFIQPSSHSQTTTSLLIGAHGIGQHCRHLARGVAFHWLLRRGHAAGKNSPVA